MTENKNFLKFWDLIDEAFTSDGPSNNQIVQILFKILVSQLDLKDLKIDLDLNSFKKNIAKNLKNLKIKENLVPGNEESFNEYQKVLVVEDPDRDGNCRNLTESEEMIARCLKKKNSVMEMLENLNVSKRVEALEVTIDKLTSMFDLFLKRNPHDSMDFDDNSSEGSCVSTKTSEIMGKTDDAPDEDNASQVSLLGSPYSKTKASSRLSNTKPSTEDVSANKLMELPRILDFSLCQPKRLLKLEKCGKPKNLKRKLKTLANINDMRDFDRCLKEQIDSVNLLVSENFFFLENEICDLQKAYGEDVNNLQALASVCEDNEIRLNEAVGKLKKMNESFDGLKTMLDDIQEDNENLHKFCHKLDENIQQLFLKGAERDWVEERLESYATIKDMDEKLSIVTFQTLYSNIECYIEKLLKNQDDLQNKILMLALGIDELKQAEEERKKELMRATMKKQTVTQKKNPCDEKWSNPYPCFVADKNGAIFRGNPTCCKEMKKESKCPKK